MTTRSAGLNIASLLKITVTIRRLQDMTITFWLWLRKDKMDYSSVDESSYVSSRRFSSQQKLRRGVNIYSFIRPLRRYDAVPMIRGTYK